MAEEFARRMPGSSAEALGPAQTVAALARGDVDAVVFPYVQQYPKGTVEAVERFVAEGGTLVVLGGGEVQVSDTERHTQLEQMFRDHL